MLLERALLVLDILIRRWWVLLAVPVLALPVAYVLATSLPKEYVAKSVILLQPANQSSNWDQGRPRARNYGEEQVKMIEAWLKSDQVLMGLLPSLFDGEIPEDPMVRHFIVENLRDALQLDVVGNSVLEISLTDSESEGLGRKLEIIVSRLMEGMIQPDEDVLTAAQLLVMRNRDAVARAEAILAETIEAAGLQPTQAVRLDLQQLSNLRRQWRNAVEAEGVNQTARSAVGQRIAASGPTPSITQPVIQSEADRLADAITKLQQRITPETTAIAQLEKDYARFVAAQAKYEVAQRTGRSSRRGYIGGFSAPEKLTIVGRPQDPQIGKNPGKKLAIAVMLASVLMAVGIVLLLELFTTRLRLRDEFEALTGLPTIARLPKTSGL